MAAKSERDPLILLVPGLSNSGPGHWQTLWERELPDCQRVDLGMWDTPHRNTWVNKLNLAIERAGRRVVLVAHSLGCHAAAWWAEYERPGPDSPVAAALLVAPPDVDRPHANPHVARFGAAPARALPFPAILAASQNDPTCAFDTAKSLAAGWECHFADAGAIGHINADSNIGDWPYGKALLDRMLRRIAQPAPPRAPARKISGRAQIAPQTDGTGKAGLVRHTF